MYVIVKNCNYDFNTEIEVIATTFDKETAKTIFQKAVETEKEVQQKGSISYDTEECTEKTYSAYNDGYEATDHVNIFIAETEYIDRI